MRNDYSRFAQSVVLVPFIMALTFLSGCATIFTGTTDQVSFDSNVPGVRVFIDGQFKGETPLTLTLSRNFMNGEKFDAKFEKGGYQTQEFQLKRQFNGIAFLDISSTLTSGGVDLMTGALMRYSPTDYHVQMLRTGHKDKSAEYQRSLNLYRYALTNYRNVQIDISHGGGEYLDTLSAALSGSQGHADEAITKLALHNAPALLDAANAEDFIRRLNNLLGSQPELRTYEI